MLRQGRFLTNVRPLPLSAGIEQYQRQAREFAPDGVDAEAQLAQWYQFEHWAALEHWVAEVTRAGSIVSQFEAAVEAVINGDAGELASRLRQNPALVHERSRRTHAATLLIYVGANGVEGYRQRTPPNAVTIAQMLLDAGAEVDAVGKMYRGTTTLGLVATSVHPVITGVQEPLMLLLLDSGAAMSRAVAADYTNGLVVKACLANGRPAAAKFLAERGAQLDLEGAAGVGRLDVVKSYFAGATAPPTPENINAAFRWACGYGHDHVVDFLIDREVDLAAAPNGETALHYAAGGGHFDIAKLLVERGAPVNAKDSQHDATPLEWSLWGWMHPSPDAKPGRHHDVVRLLRAAGSSLHPEWLADETLQRDAHMMAALGADGG